MTTATLAAGNRAMDNVVRPRRSLEELVDRLMDALFTTMEMAVRPRRSLAELVDQLMEALKFEDDDGTAERGAARSIHEARRLRQAGDVDGALAVLGGGGHEE